MAKPVSAPPKWTPARPNALVIACSDGRLQESTDHFLATQFRITQYDRFYVPGGGGALSGQAADAARAERMRAECRYLIDLHQVRKIVVLFHGPVHGGRIETACADYRRKLPYAPVAEIRTSQEADAVQLYERRREWAGDGDVYIYRCEVDREGNSTFVSLAGVALQSPPRVS